MLSCFTAHLCSRVPRVRYPQEKYLREEVLPRHCGACVADSNSTRKPGPVRLALQHFHGEMSGSQGLPILQVFQFPVTSLKSEQ